MSFGKASKAFGIPKTTILDHKNGKYKMGSVPGRKPVIPKNLEDSMVAKAIEASNKGFGVSKKQLLLKTARLCRTSKLPTPFKNGVPADTWWQGLKSRHPELSLRKPEALSSARTKMMNPTVIHNFFKDLAKIVSELGIAAKPERVWNCDETGKKFQHRPINVVARKGARVVSSRTSDSRENVTILACVNAAGTTI
ncbi:uncharacterized protein LOC117326861 [Pecten maximus]|uniref:uncharacterized protein LOC117326861 n=1 Tax=Pecten maximus TaxID=6579 RepID=UPI00145839C4|nr:uncharacterized protein LOC117326861 [Pecten maximus]